MYHLSYYQEKKLRRPRNEVEQIDQPPGPNQEKQQRKSTIPI
jgi:hypothetical protein